MYVNSTLVRAGIGMKRKSNAAAAVSIASIAAIAALSSLTGSANGASQTWLATPTDDTWVNGANWSGGAAPGLLNPVGNVVNADIATFNNPIPVSGIGSSTDPIMTDATRYLGGVTFDSANCGAYVIGTTANVLQVCHNSGNNSLGAITVSASETNPEIFGCLVQVRLPSSTSGVYNFVNNSTTASASLNFSNGISTNAANTRPTTYNLNGSNTGLNVVTSFANNGGTSAVLINKSGTGLWIITGASTTTTNSSAGIAPSTTITNGTLAIENAASLGAAANAVNVGPGMLRLDNGITCQATNISMFNGGILESNAGTNSINKATIANTASASYTFTTALSTDILDVGTGSANSLTGGVSTSVINVSGPGTVSLPGASNYAGSWSINSGTLALGNTTALGVFGGVAAPVTFGASSTGVLQLNGNSTVVSGLTTNSSVGTPIVMNGGTAGGLNTITVNNSIANTYSGLLQDGPAGQLGLVKSGAGALTLSASNTYTGGTIISSGSLLAVNTTGSATGSGAITINAGGLLGGTGFVTGPVTVNNNGGISPGVTGVGSLSVGSLILNTGAQLAYDITSPSSLDQTLVTTNGGLSVNGGVLTINGGLTAFTTNGTYNLIGYTGAIGGTGVSALTVNPANENTAANTYTFGTAGGFVTLTIGSAGGTLAYWNHAVTSGSANGNWSTGPWTGGITPNADKAFAGFGGGGATITAPTTVTVDGAYTVGTLAFATNSSSYTLAAGAGANLNLSNGNNAAAITDSAGTHTIAAPLTLNTNGATVTVLNAGDMLTISGAIAPGTGSGGITKAGPGTLALLGNNSYTGNTLLNSGVTQINSGSSLGASSSNAVFAGGSIQVVGSVVSTRTYQTDGDAAASANVVIDTNGNNLDLSGGTIAPASAGTGGLVKNGVGTLTLATANSFTGPTVVNGGSLVVSANTSLGDAPTGASLTLNGATLVSTATMTLDNGGQTNTRSVVIGASGATLAPATGTVLTIDGSITGSGQLALNDVGQVTIQSPTAGQNTYAGGTLINTGTIQLGDINSQVSGLGTGPVTFNGSSGTINLRYSANSGPTYGTFANNIVFTNGSTGTLITTPRGDVTGTVTGNGTFNIQTDYVRSQFDYNFTGFTGLINITPNTGGGDFRMDNTLGFPNSTVNIGTGSTLYDIFNFAAPGGTIPIGALTGTGFLSGDGAAAGRTLTWAIGGLNTSTGFTGVISDSTGPTAINKVGTGTWTISGADSYSGITQVSSGTLALASGTALPVAPTLTPAIGTTLNISSGASLVATNVANTPYVAVIGTLNNSGQLDIVNNALVINGGVNTVAGISAQVVAGLSGATSGIIISSAAASNTRHNTAVAVIPNDDGTGNPIIQNSTLDRDVTINTGNIIVKYTYYGDTNLDGMVDGTDYSRIDNAYLNNQTPGAAPLTGWYNGDFNYDGVINGSDYTLIDNAYNSQAASLAAAIASPSASVTALVSGGDASAVPEPGTLGLLGIGSLALLGRRKSKLSR